MMRTFTRKTLPLIITSALASVHFSAQAYDNVVIFGDSLSDGGIYGSRFTTNPGLTSAEYLAQGLGFTTTTSTTGGTNYAQGGARVNSPSATTPAGFAQRPVSTQVTEYLTSTGGLADPNAVYLIQGGANDIFQNLAMVQAGAMTQADLQQSLITTGTDFAKQVATLKAAGAKTIIVQNLPNLGAAPAFSGALSSTGTALSVGYNTVLNKAITAFGTDVMAVDTFGLISEIVANPSAYGFTNATGMACTTASSITCSPATLATPDAASTYVFADSVHPTTATQKINAQYMLSVLNAPSQISLLSAAPLAGGMTRQRLLAANMPHAGSQTWHTFANYDHTPSKFDDAKSTANSFLAGVDRKVGAGRLGLSVGYQKYDGSFGGSAGGFNMNEPSVGVYYSRAIDVNGKQGNFLATASYGDLQVSNLKRNIALGATTRTETGDTSGHHWSLGIAADATVGTFAKGKISHGPVVNLSYEDLELKAFDEASNTSSAMSYSAQSRRGFLASLGYQLKGNFGRVSPYAKIAYEFNGTRGSDVRAHVKSMYSGFNTPAYETSDGFRGELGASMDITPAVNAHIGLGSTFGKSSGKETSVSLGVDAKF